MNLIYITETVFTNIMIKTKDIYIYIYNNFKLKTK